MRLPEEHPFEQFVTRPRVGQAVALIDSAMLSIQRVANESEIARAEAKAKEIVLISQAKESIEMLKAAIDEARRREQAFERIPGINAKIDDATKQGLVWALQDVSQLYGAKAEIQLNVATKTEALISDLQDVLRSRDSITCLLGSALPRAVLAARTAELDDAITQFRAKSDTELTAAKNLLQPIYKSIVTKEAKLTNLRNDISNLNAELKQELNNSQGFVRNASVVHRITEASEQSLVDSLTVAARVQDALLIEIREVFQQELELGYHVTSLLTALVSKGDTPVLSALAPPPAMQPKRNPAVWW